MLKEKKKLKEENRSRKNTDRRRRRGILYVHFWGRISNSSHLQEVEKITDISQPISFPSLIKFVFLLRLLGGAGSS